MWPERIQRAPRRALERIWRQCGRNVAIELPGELWRGSGDNVGGTSPESFQESSEEDLATMWPERLQRAPRRALERTARNGMSKRLNFAISVETEGRKEDVNPPGA
jgi:hypothetical protein